MTYNDDEPPTKCGRLDCRVQSLGMMNNAQGQVVFHDKSGAPIPNPAAQLTETRHCETCGATWSIEVKP